jgi:radical SAM superfamily enzyme YgiQ (UPF0313 family)
MRIALIFPNRSDDPEPYSSQSLVSTIGRSILGLGRTNFLPPLSLMMIAAVTPKEHEIVFIDERFDIIDFDEKIDVVGITVSTEAAKRAYGISDEFRKRGIPVVLGGIHPSIQRQEAKQHADSVVVGEGETVWPTILDDAKNKSLREIYLGGHNCDFEKLPWPNRNILKDTTRYLTTKTIAATRGCENRCSFCSIGLATGKRFRTRRVEDVLAEIDSIPGKYVVFVDDNLGWDIQYAKALFRELKKKKIKWFGQISINALEDDELLTLAAESGCLVVDIGFESVSPDTIVAMNKDFTNDPKKYSQIITKIHRFGIAILGNFIVGFDSDSKNTFQELAAFIRETAIELPNINILIPYPGSSIHRSFEKQSRLLSLGWEYYDETPPYVVFQPAQFLPVQLLREYIALIEKIHSPISSLSRILRSGTWKSAEVLFVGLHQNLIKKSIIQKESLKAIETAMKFSE